MDIVFVGAGNLATHLSQSLQRAGHRILQVFSRTEESASELAGVLGCPWTTRLEDVSRWGQIYVFALRDSVLLQVSHQLYNILRENPCPGRLDCGASGLFVHTAGSLSIDLLPTLRRGVLYPMQTFSKHKPVDFSQIPIFIESPTDVVLLRQISGEISQSVYELNGEGRLYLHLAAVFACNFSNHMYSLCDQILAAHKIPFDVMLPLIDETARKVHQMPPLQAQTGPAVRHDENVIQHHLDLLEDGGMKDIYRLLSKDIYDRLQSEEN